MKILLTGSDASQFQFISKALEQSHYNFEFIELNALEQTPASYLPRVKLIIINTLPYSDKEFSRFGFFRSNPQFGHIPLLALIPEKPPRLRYRLTQMGVDDYLTIPFDKLDLQLRIRNLLRYQSTLNKLHHQQQENELLNASLRSITATLKNYPVATHSPGSTDAMQLLLQDLCDFCQCRAAFVIEKTSSGEANISATSDPGVISVTQFPLSDMPEIQRILSKPQAMHAANLPANDAIAMDLSSLIPFQINAICLQPFYDSQNRLAAVVLLKTSPAPFSEIQQQVVANLPPVFRLLSTAGANTQIDPATSQLPPVSGFGERLLDQLNFGILVVDENKYIRYLNSHAANLLNKPSAEAIHKPLGRFLDNETVEEMLQSLGDAPEDSERPEVELRDVQGNKMAIGFSVRRFYDDLNRENGYIISLKDITKSKKMREEMRRIERLASLGVMASGIAHEIRNPLAGIKAMVQTFQDEFEPQDSRNEYLKRIIRLVNRMDDLLRTLFSYARPPKPNRRFHDVSVLLGDVLSLTRQKFKEHSIHYQEKLEANLPLIYVDSAQIQQVLVNLLLNSIDAIGKSGSITTAIRPFLLSETSDPAHRFPYTAYEKGGQFLEIRITDNGCGISKADLKQIFNPFFTTKSNGTGLGLSIVYQIIKENDGYIFYESEVGQGTDCYVYLPTDLK